MKDNDILNGDTAASLLSLFTTINRRRKDLGLSQRQLAAKSGVSTATIARLLGGYTRGSSRHAVSNAHIDHVLKLCIALELGITLLPLRHATDMRHARARKVATALVNNKAELARMPHPTREMLIEKFMINLLKGPSGKLWE